MPSKSPAQARFMAAVAHDPNFADEVGIPMSVGKEFNKADRGSAILSGSVTTHNKRYSRKNFHERSKLK